jgi:hypothetical protein
VLVVEIEVVEPATVRLPGIYTNPEVPGSKTMVPPSLDLIL